MGRLGDRYVIVSGSEDTTVRMWDEQGQPIGSPLAGHTGQVTSVAVGRLGDRYVIVSGSEDTTVQMWDEHGHPIGTLSPASEGTYGGRSGPTWRP